MRTDYVNNVCGNMPFKLSCRFSPVILVSSSSITKANKLFCQRELPTLPALLLSAVFVVRMENGMECNK